MRILSVFIAVHLWLISCLFSSFAYAQETITVAVASSLYAEMYQQAEVFEQKKNVRVRLVSGSTGRLYNQIIYGAPFDVFVAADEQRPTMLVKQHKVFERAVVGRAYLAVMLAKGDFISPEQLTESSIRHIAIANPDVAPFGKMSKKVLQELGLWQDLQHKFVYAQNAMQVTMMVDKGIVDAGFVATSQGQYSVAAMQYHAVILADKPVAYQWLKSMRAIDHQRQQAVEEKKPVVKQQLVRR